MFQWSYTTQSVVMCKAAIQISKDVFICILSFSKSGSGLKEPRNSSLTNPQCMTLVLLVCANKIHKEKKTNSRRRLSNMVISGRGAE